VGMVIQEIKDRAQGDLLMEMVAHVVRAIREETSREEEAPDPVPEASP
jgi:hypothetical protein